MSKQETLTVEVGMSKNHPGEGTDLSFIIPEDFDIENFQLIFCPVGNVSILLENTLTGTSLDEKGKKDSFIWNCLSLYTPQPQVDDIISMVLMDGSDSRLYVVLFKYDNDMKWHNLKFGPPIRITSED